ncbi:hypothetical protein HYH03_007855 [Edaphochlamys debaryana]|uniref:Uncharacterized protein n=1 Tax=Edaphochlamys debaryana TaxID=47281 RepID=A0A835Y298_9CHLO|nr:hypothetical protein HYH03_007855 [Edaphochlamys debaryana]|eukprot:KAG2493919.1 hypothetical protein HYH03_007855 [Edaphochlamys debaryana]
MEVFRSPSAFCLAAVCAGASGPSPSPLSSAAPSRACSSDLPDSLLPLTVTSVAVSFAAAAALLPPPPAAPLPRSAAAAPPARPPPCRMSSAAGLLGRAAAAAAAGGRLHRVRRVASDLDCMAAAVAVCDGYELPGMEGVMGGF